MFKHRSQDLLCIRYIVCLVDFVSWSRHTSVLNQFYWLASTKLLRVLFLKGRRERMLRTRLSEFSKCLICFGVVHNFEFSSLGVQMIKHLWPSVILVTCTHTFLQYFFFLFHFSGQGCYKEEKHKG